MPPPSTSHPFLYQGTARRRHGKHRSDFDMENPGSGIHPLLPSTNEAKLGELSRREDYEETTLNQIRYDESG